MFFKIRALNNEKDGLRNEINELNEKNEKDLNEKKLQLDRLIEQKLTNNKKLQLIFTHFPNSMDNLLEQYGDLIEDVDSLMEKINFAIMATNSGLAILKNQNFSTLDYLQNELNSLQNEKSDLLNQISRDKIFNLLTSFTEKLKILSSDIDIIIEKNYDFKKTEETFKASLFPYIKTLTGKTIRIQNIEFPIYLKENIQYIQTNLFFTVITNQNQDLQNTSFKIIGYKLDINSTIDFIPLNHPQSFSTMSNLALMINEKN